MTTNKNVLKIAKETIQNFPNKLNATHKEVIDLVKDYDYYTKIETDNKANNDKYKAKYKEIEPLIEKVEKANETLQSAQCELNRFIDKIFAEEITKANEDYKNYIIIEHVKGENATSIDRMNARTLSEHSEIYTLIKTKEDLKKLEPSGQADKIRRLLYSGYRDNTWLRSESYWDSKWEIEKKLKTRLKKLGVIEA